MKIKLSNGKPTSEGSIQALQTALGCPLSGAFSAFLRGNDGAKPEANTFKAGERTTCRVSRFIPAADILKERANIENLPRKAYPIAWAAGGNYVFVDEDRNGAVFFWDHELPEDTIQLAPDFDAFLNLLEPFDIKSAELKPGQAKKVWIDPEFLKRLKK